MLSSMGNITAAQLELGPASPWFQSLSLGITSDDNGSLTNGIMLTREWGMPSLYLELMRPHLGYASFY